MANILDYERLSTFVAGVVDRKVVAIAQSITSSTGYLKGIVAQVSAYVTAAAGSASDASGSATRADGAASSALIVYSSFTSLFLGLSTSDPIASSIGNAVSKGGFYIRASDGRLRYAASVTNGVINWTDATVAADPASVRSAAGALYLTLAQTAQQTVQGPVNFTQLILVPRVTSWSSNQAATAVDVAGLVSVVQQNLTNEASRASTAENNLANNKVDKSSYQYGSNAYGSYEISPSGVIRQWGQFSLTSSSEIAYTLTLPIDMGNTNWVLSTTPMINNSNTKCDMFVQVIKNTRTTKTVKVQYQLIDSSGIIDGFEWEAVGHP